MPAVVEAGLVVEELVEVEVAVVVLVLVDVLVVDVGVVLVVDVEHVSLAAMTEKDPPMMEQC